MDFLVGIVGLPYWMVLIPLRDIMLGDEVRQQIPQTPPLWLTFGCLAAGHFWKAFQLGYDAMPDNQLKQRVRWDVYLLVLRAIAMFMMAAHGLPSSGAADGDPPELFRDLARTRHRRSFRRSVELYEYDPENPSSSRRRR